MSKKLGPYSSCGSSFRGGIFLWGGGVISRSFQEAVQDSGRFDQGNYGGHDFP